MGFESLPADLQNIYLADFNQWAKIIFILLFIFLSILYIKKFKPREESIFKGVRILRGFYYLIAWIFLSMTPFYVGFMAPAVPFDDILRIFLIGFSINLGILAPIVLLNFVYYGTAFLTDLLLTNGKADPIKKKTEEIIGKPEGLI